jgi:tetratricopeptide (TPR) repeat protein
MVRTAPDSVVAAFFAELGHRGVYRTAVAYTAGTFVLWQAADIVFPALGFPPSAMTALVVGAAAGFPGALILAWLYEIVPERGKRSGGGSPRLRMLRRAFRIAVGSTALAACGGLAWWVLPHEKLVIPEGDFLLIGDFRNRAGDSIFDGSLHSALQVAIAQSPHVSLLPWSHVQAALAEMRLPDDAPLDDATAMEVALRMGIAAVLLPSIDRVGNRYQLTTRLVDPATQSTAVARSTTAVGAEEVLSALDALARQLRSDLGEPLSSMVAQRVPLDRATTGSLEALKAWTDGNRHWRMGLVEEAGLLYRRAVELDSTFAMAHADLGQFLYWARSDAVAGEEQMRAAIRHSELVTHRERLLIQAKAAAWRGDRASAITVYRALLADYPRHSSLWSNLGYQFLMLGRREEAIDAYEQVVRLDSLSATGWINLATLRSGRGETAEAIRLYERAFAIAPEYRMVGNINSEWGFALLSLGRVREAEEAFRLMLEGTDAQRSQGHRYLGQLSLATGRFDAAVDHLRRAVILSETGNIPTTHIRNLLYLTEALELTGQPTARELREAHRLAVAEPVSAILVANLGTRFARNGQLGVARVMLDTARSRVNGGRVERCSVERLAGEIARAAGDFPAAVEHYQAALAHSPQDDLARFAMGSLLQDRGELREAEVHLRKVVTPDRVVGHEKLVPTILTHYRLGRLLEESGRPEEAAERYRRLLDFWGQSDTPLELVADARQRLRR